MASISFVRGKWRALVRRKGQPQRSRSFVTRDEAEQWARGVEHSADRGRPVGGLGPAVDELLRSYRQARADVKHPIRPTSTEHYMLARLEAQLAGVRLSRLDTPAIVALAQRLRRQGCGPYTTKMHVSKLGTALRYACSLQGLEYLDPVRAAMPTLAHLRLVGAGAERDRRPTAEEWARLLAWMEGVNSAIPMRDVIEFAATTAMRLGEIVRIRWADFDPKAKTLMIRDRKDPRAKVGNHQVIPLLFGAVDIVKRQPKTEERIFPFEGGTISDWFTRACDALEIDDLHFHDLRHEAISRMFERGMQIPEVAAVSGHKSWSHLRRYVQITPQSIVRQQETRRSSPGSARPPRSGTRPSRRSSQE